MRNKLSIYIPTKVEKTLLTAEVCLRLTDKPGYILLHIVDSRTGEHVESGNLLHVYPDGTYKIIPGAKFGANEERGFKNRNVS